MSSRVVTGEKQPYRMNDMNFNITLALVILFKAKMNILNIKEQINYLFSRSNIL